MSYMINKKGLSEVISVVMIIMLTVSAAAILFVSVKSSISQLSPAIDCTERTLTKPLSVKYVCYNSESKRVELTVQRDIKSDSLSQVKFRITGDGSGEEWACGDSCGGCNILSPGETKNYYLEELQTKMPESIIISADGCVLEKIMIRAC